MGYEKPIIETIIFDTYQVCSTTLVSGDPSVDSGNMGWGDKDSSGSFGEPF